MYITTSYRWHIFVYGIYQSGIGRTTHKEALCDFDSFISNSRGDNISNASARGCVGSYEFATSNLIRFGADTLDIFILSKQKMNGGPCVRIRSIGYPCD